MKILALTGGIASGKTTVARMFRKLGAVVLHADRIAHQTYRPGTQLFREIVRRYGKKILDARGRIDRKKLGAILFASKSEKVWLESRIHPETIRWIGKKIQNALRRKPRLLLVEAALHVESGYYRAFPELIVVKIDPRVQLKRLVEREGLSVSEAKRRMSSQTSQAHKCAVADWIIENSGSLVKTEHQVKRLWKRWKTMTEAFSSEGWR